MNMQTKTMNVEPIPVSIIKSPEELTSLAVEFGSTSNFSVPLIGTATPPVQILQRRPTRSKAIILVTSLGGLGSASTSAFGTVPAAVGAGTTIATTGTLPPGTYTVYVNISTSGTVTTADANNMQLLIGATVIGTLMNSNSGANTPFPNGPFVVIVPAAGAAILVKSVGAGSGTATYNADIIATPQAGSGGATGIMFASRQDFLANANNPQGFLVTSAPKDFKWESQQPLYAAAIGGGPITVSVIDQAQAGTQAQAEESVQSYDLSELGQEEGGRSAGKAGNEY